jgi:hypothetical protein
MSGVGAVWTAENKKVESRMILREEYFMIGLRVEFSVLLLLLIL